MGDGAERREARRFLMSLPMRVVSRAAKTFELYGNTRDVSYRGLYFIAEAEFAVGNDIEFVLTLPPKVSSAGDVDIRCRGKVVRVEARANGHMGVAARIEGYEFQPARATAA
jgi:hypothetical protein